MKQLVWLLKWLLKAAIFFALFAFALNNQQDATVHFFFGTQWRTPLVWVVLTAFAAVIAVGVVYNNARIALAERTWELASLRVLGFTRAEVSAVLSHSGVSRQERVRRHELQRSTQTTLLFLAAR